MIPSGQNILTYLSSLPISVFNLWYLWQLKATCGLCHTWILSSHWGEIAEFNGSIYWHHPLRESFVRWAYCRLLPPAWLSVERGFMTHYSVCTNFTPYKTRMFWIFLSPNLDQNNALPTLSFDLIVEELEYPCDSLVSLFNA